ncbi:hypothetical protein Nepgr_023320 [Nepenthes gracilis]|uniref:Protein EXECUTER 2, chloroplastic n=1 Tax=Nepenthes gracilis TaxID=150966 RepID=A0AAD3XXS5_NEPGR|nr:hypothetical protein Nepgr_023320 [Nepenthes gracilis]
MVVASPWGMRCAVSMPQLSRSAKNKPGCSRFNLHQFDLHRKSCNRNNKTSNLYYCRCCSSSSISSGSSSNANDTSNVISSASEWDWNRWTRHFSEIEQAESYASVLKFQLEDAVEKEDFQEATKLKYAISEATSKDAVAEIMTELNKAIDEERYQDASKLSRCTGSSLVGWWVGCSNDSDDPFGRLVRITPGVGRFIGRSYTPRQLVTATSGTVLFELYLVKDTKDTYMMQVVFLQRAKNNSTNSPSLQPKPIKEDKAEKQEETSLSLTHDTDNVSVIGLQGNEEKAGKQEEKSPNIEGVTEEGVKSVINFLRDKIPGLKLKVMNVEVKEEVIEDSDALKQLAQEGVEDTGENSEDEADNMDDMEGNGDLMEDGKDLDVKVFIGGVLHNNNDVPEKDEYLRLPAEIKDFDRDSFVLCVPGVDQSGQSKISNIQVAAIVSQSISELMPPDVAKTFLGANKGSSKVSKDVREIIKLAIGQAQRRNRLSEYTTFRRLTISKGNLDPFDGLYVGAFGPYGTEIVQLRRKFGHWNSGNHSDKSSDVEFFEYVEAVKLTGDLNVPAGKVTFRAKIGKGSRTSSRGLYPDELGLIASYKGQGRIAEFGFGNPKWVEGELLQLNGKGIGPYARGADLGFLYIVPEQSFLVLFNRLNLPD